MKIITIMATLTVAMLTVASPAEARKAQKHHHYKISHVYKVKAEKRQRQVVATNGATQFCGDRVCGEPTVPTGPAASFNKGRAVAANDANGNESPRTATSSYKGRPVWDRVSIPTPAGTWRTVASCAHRLSAAWKLGPGLDATITWLSEFPRVSQPAPGVAVYTPGHIMGVTGGHEGAWEIVSYNGDGHHGNVKFKMASLIGFTLLDTSVRRTVTLSSAKRHHHAKRGQRPVRMVAYRPRSR